jgi:hypothetical protein
MKIIGGHDYYDGAMGYGIDSSIVLQRYEHKCLDTKRDFRFGSYREMSVTGEGGRYSSIAQVRSFTVIFCSTIFRGCCVRSSVSSAGPQYFWSYEKMSDWVSSHRDKLEMMVDRRWYSSATARSRSAMEYFTPHNVDAVLREYMIRNRIAILLERRTQLFDDVEVLVNPYGLKKIGFAKALDPFTAFQELSMWVGGVLGGQSPETVTITDDKVLAESHGYDKHSFRSSVRK